MTRTGKFITPEELEDSQLIKEFIEWVEGEMVTDEASACCEQAMDAWKRLFGEEEEVCKICGGKGILRDSHGNPVEQCPCMNPNLSLAEWIRERMNNCVRIALTKKGKEKRGWLEDANYFAALTHMEGALGRIYYLSGARRSEIEKDIFAEASKALRKDHYSHEPKRRNMSLL